MVLCLTSSTKRHQILAGACNHKNHIKSSTQCAKPIGDQILLSVYLSSSCHPVEPQHIDHLQLPVQAQTDPQRHRSLFHKISMISIDLHSVTSTWSVKAVVPSGIQSSPRSNSSCLTIRSQSAGIRHILGEGSSFVEPLVRRSSNEKAHRPASSTPFRYHQESPGTAAAGAGIAPCIRGVQPGTVSTNVMALSSGGIRKT